MEHQVGEQIITNETDMHVAGESLKQVILRNYLKRVTDSWNVKCWGSKAWHTVRVSCRSHCHLLDKITSSTRAPHYLFLSYRRVFACLESVRREGRD